MLSRINPVHESLVGTVVLLKIGKILVLTLEISRTAFPRTSGAVAPVNIPEKPATAY